MVQKLLNLKQKILKLLQVHYSVDNMKKTGFTGYVYDFSVDYDLLQSMILKRFISI